MKVHDVVQGTSAWLAARAGVLTASEFDNLLTPEWKKRGGETPQTYILRKVAERCLGYPLEMGGSWAMDQGQILEKEVLPWLAFDHDIEARRVGFITADDGRIGCSPDGLIGDDGGVEIKCPQAPAHIRYLLGGVVPKDYLAQVHGSLYVTGRKWWLFVSYARNFPALLVRVERDEEIMRKIDAALKDAVADFDDKLARVLALKDETDAPRREAGFAQQEADEAAARARHGGELPGERWARERASA